MSRLHRNGPDQLPTRLTNVTFDNQEINKLLVDEKKANIFDLPPPTTTTTVSTTASTLSTTLVIGIKVYFLKTDEI